MIWCFSKNFWKSSELKFMFSRKATKVDDIFTVNLMLCSKHQIDSEYIVNFHGLFRKYGLYEHDLTSKVKKKSSKCNSRKTLAPFWIESHVCQANQRDQRPPKSAKGLFKIALMSQILEIITLTSCYATGCPYHV